MRGGVLGEEIISLKKVLENLNEQQIIVVSPTYDADEIYQQLIRSGIEKNQIEVFNNYTACGIDKHQYFDKNIIKYKEDEVFVDGGCFNLQTSKIFLKNVETYGVTCKKILAFEPDDISYKRICSLNTNKDKITVINSGLWFEQGVLGFARRGTASSRISNEQADCTVKVDKLDNYLDEEITFIKMDIEGAELEALKGGKKVIETYKPKLAISVYHKKQDIYDIPLYLKSIVPEYKFYLRHYSNAHLETVLYAVI